MANGANDNDLPIYSGQVYGLDGSTQGVSAGLSLVGLSLPTSVFSLFNNPLVSNGYITASFNTQSSNLVFASPTSSSGIPSFRQLTPFDISGAGTVTNFTFNNLNEFTGTVSTSTTTPSLTLKLNSTGIAAGTYGTSTQIPRITFDATGRATSITTVSGSAGSGTVTSTSVTNTGNITGTVSTATTTPAITLDLTNTGITSGTYGSSSQIPVITFDSKGRATSISTVSAGTSSGGGTSSGTVTNFSYTNTGSITGTVSTATSTPVLTADLTDTGVTAGTYGNSYIFAKPTVDVKGRITSVTTESGRFVDTIAVSNITPYALNASIATVSTALGLKQYNISYAQTTVSANFFLGANSTASSVVSFRGLVNADFPASGASAGTYGSSSQIPVVTVNAQGIVTGISTTAGATGSGTVTQFNFTNNGNITGTVSTATTTPTLIANLTTTGITAGTYGSGSQIPVITYDIYGRATSITTTSAGTTSGGGGTTVTKGTTTISFGASTQTEYNTITTVSTAAAVTGAVIQVFPDGASSDHSLDEMLAENLNLTAGNIINGVSFDIRAYCDLGTYGIFNVNYIII